MNSLKPFLLSATTILIALIHLLSPSSCYSRQKQPSDTTPGLLLDEKTRLGSTPPSCHNKCNQCHPCMAVQAPTLPSHERVQRGVTGAITMDYFDSSPSSAGNKKYSNYKPLGWKCRCGDHFFNP